MRIAGPNTAVRQLRFAPAKAIAARWVRSFCAAALSLAALCATPAFAEGEGGPIVGVRTDASAWRLIDGEGVVGVMGVGPFLNLGQVDPLTPEALLSGNQAGFFVIHVEGRGVFEGLLNFKNDGRKAVGVFWPEGRADEDIVSGFLDIDGLETPGVFGGSGTVSFSDDGSKLKVSAR